MTLKLSAMPTTLSPKSDHKKSLPVSRFVFCHLTLSPRPQLMSLGFYTLAKGRYKEKDLSKARSLGTFWTAHFLTRRFLIRSSRLDPWNMINEENK